jgi:hypothetical protein
VTAFTLWYAICEVYVLGAMVPATLLSTLVLCVMLYTRIRARRRWQAAWERYAKVNLSRKRSQFLEEEITCRVQGRGIEDKPRRNFHAGPQPQGW